MSLEMVSVSFKQLIAGAFAASDETVNMEVETPGGWQENEELREENGERIAFERIRYKEMELYGPMM